MNKNKHTKSIKNIKSLVKSKYIFFDRFNIYGLDIRSILLFRFTLGLVLLYNLFVYKIFSFKSIYSPKTGFLGNDFVKNLAIDKPLSWLKYIDSDFGIIIVFISAAICYLLFTFNIKPFFSALLSYFFFSSINLRYFPIRAGWDYYIDALLFLTILLSFFYDDNRKENENRSSFAYLIIFQVGIIYLFAALSKYGTNWKNGTAVSYILSDIQLNTSLADYVIKALSSTIIKILTYTTLIWEFTLIFILFFPYKNEKLRLFVSFSILIFHWTINLFADVGHFKYITTCVAILLLPDVFWNAIPARITNTINLIINKWSKSDIKINLKQNNYFTTFKKAVLIYILSAIFFSNFFFILKTKGIIDINKSQNISNTILSIYPKKSYFFSQNWAMYSPNPMTELGVLKMEGITINGKVINIIKPSNKSSDIFKEDFNTYSYNNQLLTIFKSKIVQHKDDKIIQSWFQYYVNNYTKDSSLPKIKTASLYLYSINGKEFLKTNEYNFIKEEIIKADISY